MASSVVPKEASKEVVSSPPSDHMIHHTPMSERQQLALIKKMEKANAEGIFLQFFNGNGRRSTASVAQCGDSNFARFQSMN